MKDSRYYDVIEAAELIETSETTIDMLVNRGELDMLRLDVRNRPVFTEDNILDYLIRKEEKKTRA